MWPGAGMTPRLPLPRDTNEVCVPSEGTQAILGQCLRCEDLIPKAGTLSLPTTTLHFQQVEELLPIVGGRKEHWTDGCSLQPCERLPSVGFGPCSCAVGRQ